jgi:hypothetical protein
MLRYSRGKLPSLSSFRRQIAQFERWTMYASHYAEAEQTYESEIVTEIRKRVAR